MEKMDEVALVAQLARMPGKTPMAIRARQTPTGEKKEAKS